MSRRVRVAYAWAAQDDSQLSVQANDHVLVDPAADTSSGWIFCVADTAAGGQGYIPANYIDNTPVEKEKIAAAAPVAAVAASAAPVHVAATVAATAAASTTHHQQRASLTASPLFASALVPSNSASAAAAAATSPHASASAQTASAQSLMPLPSADQHLLRFRETLGNDWSVAKTQTESGAFYTKRLCSLAKHLAQAEEAYAQAIIKAVNLDSEKLQRRDGEDGCRQFWSAYQQLQTGLLDVATAHATFAMKLHAHVMEPLKECGEQSEQVMSLIVAANRDCLEEVRVLETAETDARTFALHTLTSLRMVRDREDHDDDDGGGKESSSSSSSSSSTSFWSITKSFKQGLRDAVSSVKEQVADLSGKSEEFAQERLKKRFARVTAKTERAQEACAAYQTAINQLNARRERYFIIELPGFLDQLQGLEEKRLLVSQQRLALVAEGLGAIGPVEQRVVASLGAQAAAIRPRGEIDQFVRALGHDGISHAAIPRAEYSIPADLVELDAEINSADAAAGIRRKVYGNSGGSGISGSSGGSGVAVAAAAKKEVLTIDSLARAEQLADSASANAPPPSSIPRAFAALTEAIRPNLGVEGIFRISAGATELSALRTQVANTDYRLRHTDPHAPAALLKEIVRNAPIFPASLYAACIDAAKLGDAAPDATYASLVRQLPSELGRRVLLHLLALIAEAAQPAHAATSRMTLPNLAIVFSPGILLNPSTDGASIMANNKHENRFVVELVTRLSRLD